MAFSNHDIVPDSPTNNFATLNAIYEGEGGGSGTLSEGNLKWATTSGHRRAVANIAHGSKFYVEYVCNANGGPSNVHSFGFVQISNPTGTVNSIDLYFNNYTNGSHGNRVNGSNTVVVAPAEYVYTGDVIGLCLDPDTGHGWYSINGDWKQNGNPSTGTNPVFVNIPSNDWTVYNYNANNTGTYNFGQDPTFGGTKTPSGGTNSDGSYPDKSEAGIGGFFYEPPAGAKALCTANLPDFTPTVTGDIPQDYFKAVTYAGDGVDLPNDGQQITTGMQPDLVWIKMRNGTDQHSVFDSVRGPGVLLGTNNNSDDNGWVSHVNNGNYYLLHEFNSTGFKVNRSAGGSTNESGNTFVSWSWKAGGAPQADNSNTSGAMTANSVSLNGTLQSNYTPAGSPTIYPTRMSINTNAGFSIVSYNGQATDGTVAHGLSSAPEMIVIKCRTTAGQNWVTYHAGLTPPATSILYLNTNAAAATTVGTWNSTSPTSTVFSLVGGDSQVNNSGDTFIAYCWHSVEGYSKFGSYTGNASTDGPFVYTGFRPALVITRTIASGQWIIEDNVRNPYNPVDNVVFANTADAAGTTSFKIDFLSTGFKIRHSAWSDQNGSNVTILYMCWAEHPFKYANAR